MSVLKVLATASLGVASLTAPASALAARDDGNALRGAPQIRLADDGDSTLRFTTDDRLSRTSSGRYAIAITFADGRRVSHVKAAGRHGSDHKYTARVAGDLRAGRKYTVRFRFPGQKSVTRLVKAHAAHR